MGITRVNSFIRLSRCYCILILLESLLSQPSIIQMFHCPNALLFGWCIFLVTLVWNGHYVNSSTFFIENCYLFLSQWILLFLLSTIFFVAPAWNGHYPLKILLLIHHYTSLLRFSRIPGLGKFNYSSVLLPNVPLLKHLIIFVSLVWNGHYTRLNLTCNSINKEAYDTRRWNETKIILKTEKW